jgi:5'-nucleotidase
VTGTASGPLRVLVTNDDGIDAPGLAALADAARRHGFDVQTVAPDRAMSGMSAALWREPAGGRLVSRRTAAGLAVPASPASIVVLAAVGAFGPPPAMVLSGINRGANVGLPVLHSGTVGAVLTAANSGLRGLAVSLDVLLPAGDDLSEPPDADLPWSTAASLAAGLFDEVAAAEPGTVLNLNVPGRCPVAGLRPAALAPSGQVRVVLTDAGDGHVHPAVRRIGTRVPGSDVGLLAQGYATLTALRPPAGVLPGAVPAQRTAPG